MKFVAGMCFAALLLARPEAAALGALNAMLCWAQTVAPAMFPFMALLPLLTGRGAARVCRRLPGRVMEALFHLPGGAVCALAAGMLGGSPTGALAARRVPGLRRGELKRLVAGLAGFSPAFLVGGVGAGMLGNAALGWVLLRAQMGTQLAMLCLLRNAWRGEGEILPPEAEEDARPLRGAVSAILTVCGWMTLFGALGGAARTLHPGAMPLLCLMDVVTGAAWLARRAWDTAMKMMWISALCGFGGGCVGLQNLSAARDSGLTVPVYFGLRLLAAAISATLTLAQLRYPWRLPWNAWPMVSAAMLAGVGMLYHGIKPGKKTAN